MADFTLATHADGIALITFDAEGRTMNVLSGSAWESLAALIRQVTDDQTIRGAIITSGKKNGFCAGADLDELEQYAGNVPADSERQRRVLEDVMRANRVALQIEGCGKPIAAAINGTALGGGLELALACHHRVVTDDNRVKLGLPEATLGLLPGGGGTQRLVRLLGVKAAMPLMLDGKPVSPSKALEMGLVDELSPPGEELTIARRWVLQVGDPVARWNRDGYAVPGGGPYDHPGNADFIAAAAQVAKAHMGNYPAQANIMRAVYEGVQVPMARAIEIETRYFVDTLQSPQAKAMIRTLFRSYPALRKGERRAGQNGRTDFKKVAVLGAGMMGAGIAYVCARSGVETILLDVTREKADGGKDYARRVLDRALARGELSRDEADAILARISPTDDMSILGGVDLVVETVFEDVEIKAEVTRRALAHVGPDTLFASNTSTLPISRLAKAHARADRFIGLHFHSPVDRMELVEVVVGRATSEETLAEALAFVKRIGKTAIVAHDSPFFYTSRVFDTYIREGMELLVDGWSPTMIDQVGRMTGMPRGPLELTDDVAIDLIDRIAGQRRTLLGDAAVRRRSDDVVETLIAAGRLGRKNGKGFYDYPDSALKGTWGGLEDHWPVRHPHSTPEAIGHIRRRLLHRQAVEAARCLAEGVLEDPRHADVGAILGWNFPKWTGGPISYIEQVGIGRFVDECDGLAESCGERFLPPGILRDMAAAGQSFYGDLAARSAAA